MRNKRQARRPRPGHGTRILLLTLAGGLPSMLAALLLVWLGDFTPKLRWTVTAIVGASWIGFAFAVRERAIHPIQTLSNMLAALREGDFSMRGRAASHEDPVGLAYYEANTLSETLRQQRLGALEATALLRRVMEEIDTAVFAFDGERRLRLLNRAGERLLGRPPEQLLGRDALALGLEDALEGEAPRVTELSFPGGAGRWAIRRGEFRQAGIPHRLLVLSDVSRTLREEEQQAWQRLVRVLSHEINNSLTPITSIAANLRSQLGRPEPPAGFDEDLRTGLDVIATRADALTRFMAAYARLARLPRPRLAPVDVETWVRRVAGLESRVAVEVRPGPPCELNADGDQLDQLLINLVRNAADAVLESRAPGMAGGRVGITWRTAADRLDLEVVDDGPGLSETENLFVPFFTTKPGGSGVGLALSRQIAEGHGGALTLANRDDARGCVARLHLRRA